MRVVFFSKGGPDVPSSRYRCFYFADALEAAGIATHVVQPPPRQVGWKRPLDALREGYRLGAALRALAGDDVIYLQRPNRSTLFVALLALFRRLRPGQRIIFDYCDPIFLHSPRKTRTLARLADQVIVSSKDLAGWAAPYNANVEVVPNSVPRLTAVPERPPDRCVFGWMGNAAVHGHNLELLSGALATLTRPIRVKLVGTRDAPQALTAFENNAMISLETVPWVSPEEAAAELATFDVALLPVTDSPLNRKLLTKLIEYLAAGLPVVASPVGENRFAIRSGENGFLAESAEDWRAAVERLDGDRKLRSRLGSAARSTAVERYTLDVTGPRLAGIVRSLVAR